MLRGLYTGWTGMVNEQKRLDVISNNLANADTLGYKQESVSSQSFDKLLTIKIRDGSQAYHNQAIGTMSLGVKVGEVYTDYSQGSLRGTDSPLDLALSGSGFFTITTTNAKGETVTRYTRDGSFQMTKDGYLVDSQGNRVQGTGGDIQIDPNAKDITIDNSGRITVDGEVKDILKIVDFENYDNLTKYGNNLYEGEGGFNSNNYSIKQKYLEGSNVDSTNEIAMMMETVNEFEANQKVIQTIDSILGQIASDIGRVK